MTPYPVTEEERPGLQALLRGARECVALLPATSARRRSAEDLATDLEDLLAERPRRFLDGVRRLGRAAR